MVEQTTDGEVTEDATDPEGRPFDFRDRLQEENEYPLSGWVKVGPMGVQTHTQTFVAGEDPETNWVAETKRWNNGEYSATIYPPESIPGDALSHTEFDRVGMFKTEDEAREALEWYLSVPDEDDSGLVTDGGVDVAEDGENTAQEEIGLPAEVMCDRDCPHVGVVEIDGVRLCRPHEMEVR